MDISEYYSEVPTCSRQCEEDYWGAFVDAPACGGDGENFSCFCDTSVLPSEDVTRLGNELEKCRDDNCPKTAFSDISLMDTIILNHCAAVKKASGASTTGGSGSNVTPTGTGAAAATTSPSKASSFSPSKSLVIFGSLFISLALFAQV